MLSRIMVTLIRVNVSVLVSANTRDARLGSLTDSTGDPCTAPHSTAMAGGP